MQAKSLLYTSHHKATEDHYVKTLEDIKVSESIFIDLQVRAGEDNESDCSDDNNAGEIDDIITTIDMYTF